MKSLAPRMTCAKTSDISRPQPSWAFAAEISRPSRECLINATARVRQAAAGMDHGAGAAGGESRGRPQRPRTASSAAKRPIRRACPLAESPATDATSSSGSYPMPPLNRSSTSRTAAMSWRSITAQHDHIGRRSASAIRPTDAKLSEARSALDRGSLTSCTTNSRILSTCARRSSPRTWLRCSSPTPRYVLGAL